MKKAIVGVMAIFLAVATVGCVGNKVCFERNYVSYPILEVKAEAKTEPQKSAEIKKPVETTVTPAPVASAPAEPKKAEAEKNTKQKDFVRHTYTGRSALFKVLSEIKENDENE